MIKNLYIVFVAMLFVSCRATKESRFIEQAMFNKMNQSLDTSVGCFIETKSGQVIEADRIIFNDITTNKVYINGVHYPVKDIVSVQTTLGYYAYSEDFGWVRRCYKGRMDIFENSFVTSSQTIQSNGMTHTSLPKVVKLPIVRDPVTRQLYYAWEYKYVSPLLKDEPLCLPYLKEYRKKNKARIINKYASIAAIPLGFLVSKGVDETSQLSKSESLRIYTSVALVIGGMTNWIVGGIYRTGMKRLPMLKAVYVYNFGPLPKS